LAAAGEKEEDAAREQQNRHAGAAGRRQLRPGASRRPPLAVCGGISTRGVPSFDGAF